MQRVTITIDEELLAVVDALAARRGYASRSEAVRDLVREAARREAAPEGACIATLSYVFDHQVRELPRRLAAAQHAQHDLSVAALQVPLDHAASLQVAVLRGPAAAVQRYADGVTSQRGVRHHALHLVPARVEEARHDHGAGAVRHAHVHV